MARSHENDLRDLVEEIRQMIPHITDGREELKKLDILRLKLCGNDLFEHVMAISVTDDSELYDLFGRIGSYVSDAAMEGSLADEDRVRLTETCEAVLEELSHAPRGEKKDHIEPKAYFRDLYGLTDKDSWDDIIWNVEKSKNNVTRLMREVYRFKRGLQLARKSLESYGVKYSRIEGLDCQERDEKNAIDYTMIGMRKVLSFMEESTDAEKVSAEKIEDLGFPEETTPRRSHLEQKEIQLQRRIIEALEFLLIGNGATGNSIVKARMLFNAIKDPE